MDIFEFVKFLWQDKKRLMVIFFISAIVAVVLAFVLPKKYTATATVLPPTDEGLGGGLLSRYSNIASLVGISLPNASVGPQFYEYVLKSRRILEPIINAKYKTEKFSGREVNLIEYNEIDEGSPVLDFEVCLLVIQDSWVDIVLDLETSVTEIKVTTPESQLSFEIASKLVNGLEIFNQTNVQKEARDRRDFINNRITEISEELKSSENNIQFYLEQVEDITLPEAQIILNRLKREVELKSTLFIEMKKQQEIYRVKEFTDLAPLKIVDSPYAPELWSFPKKRLVAVVFMFGVGVIVMTIYLILFYRRSLYKK